MNLSARIRPFATTATMAAVFSLTLVEPSFAQAGGIDDGSTVGNETHGISLFFCGFRRR